MGQIIWADIATLDLKEIYEYISEDSELYARRLKDKLKSRNTS